MTFDERVKRVLAERTWQILQLQHSLATMSEKLKEYEEENGSNT